MFIDEAHGDRTERTSQRTSTGKDTHHSALGTIAEFLRKYRIANHVADGKADRNDDGSGDVLPELNARNIVTPAVVEWTSLVVRIHRC